MGCEEGRIEERVWREGSGEEEEKAAEGGRRRGGYTLRYG